MLSKKIKGGTGKLLLVLAGIIIFSVSAQAAYFSINAGAENNQVGVGGGKVYNQNGVAPGNELDAGYVLQYIYAGADGAIDDPAADGGITDDDVLLGSTRTVGNDTVWGTFSNQAGMFYHGASGTYTFGSSSKIYVRAWSSNSLSPLPLFYGESILLDPATDANNPPIPNDVGIPDFWLDKTTANQPPNTPGAGQMWQSVSTGSWLNGSDSITIRINNMSDPDSGDQIKAQFEVTTGALGGTVTHQETSYGTTPRTGSVIVNISTLNEGDYKWQGRVEDDEPSSSAWTSYNSGNTAFRVDKTDPSAPTGVSANPNGWTATNSFSVNWNNPSDTSGIAAAYYKIGSAPTSDTDGTRTTSKPFTASVSGSGQHTIYVWLEDGAGNINYQNNATTTLYYDGTGPNFPDSISGSSSPTGSTSLSFSWSAASDAHSGMNGTYDYYYLLDQNASTDPGTANGTNNTNVNVTASGSGTWYLHVAAQDTVGNRTVKHSSGIVVDVTAPQINSTSPGNGAAIDASVSITFNEPMDTSSVTISSSPNPGGWSSGTWTDGDRTVTYTHNDFEYSTTYTITVTAAKDKVGNDLTGGNSFQFTTADPDAPTITSVYIQGTTTAWGYVYDTIEINGTNFGVDPGNGSRDTGTNNLTISGITIPDVFPDSGIEVYFWSDTQIVAGIPRDVSGSYIIAGDLPVQVTANGNPSNSVNFEVRPKVYGLAPSSGPIGALVSITGTAFGTTPGNISVSFNGTAATPSTANNTTADVNVPAGATTGQLLVTVNTKTSNTHFDYDPFDQIVFTVSSISISNVTIVRDGDSVGDSTTITWSTNPAGAAVDIYALERTRDVDGNYTDYFTSEASAWGPAIDSGNDTGTFTDNSQVGTGTQKYYKIIPVGDTLTDSHMATDVAGKFDIEVGPEGTHPERFFVSLPLEVTDTSPANVIGGQVLEMDMVVSFDIEKNVTAGSMYQGGSWIAFPQKPEITDIQIGTAYGYITTTARYITIAGMVREADFSRTLNGGDPAPAQWIATPYPYLVPIADAGLNSATSGTLGSSAVVYYFDALAELIGGPTDGMAFHDTAATWVDPVGQNPSSINLTPGKGYMLTEPVQASFDWDLNRN